jgi:hypothetical protein
MRREGVLWVGGFVAGFLIGLALGLSYTWVIDPPPLTVTGPAALNPHDKEIYTVLIAAAYVADEDLDRARSRLAQLEDPDTEKTIVALAERYINEGRDAHDIRALARLSDALGGTSAAMRRRTPTTEPVDLFGVVQSTALCDPMTDGLLRVYVRDGAGKGVPGVQILVNWPGGEDRFFTGFKPEADLGYADFEMEPDEIYEVEMVDVESDAAQDVGVGLADLCPDLPPDVKPSWQIVFQINR